MQLYQPLEAKSDASLQRERTGAGSVEVPSALKVLSLDPRYHNLDYGGISTLFLLRSAEIH